MMKKLRAPYLLILIFCMLALAGCSGGLGRPSDLKVNETDWVLSWSPVENATASTTYIVEIDGREYVSSKTSYSLEGLEEGSYKIRVKATDALGQTGDSKWSDAFVFTKPYENGLVYTLTNANTEYEVTRVGSARGDIEIGDVYRGKPVTSIAEKAFYSSSGVKSIVVGKNVREIGDYAFTNCSNLQSVTLPDGLSELGEHAFQGCRALQSIKLPDSLKEVKKSSFQYCRNMTSVDLGGGILSVAASAFSDCDKLSELKVPDSVRTLGEKSFYGCDLLESVTLGAAVDSIGEGAFASCVSLKSFALNQRLSAIGANAFNGCVKLACFETPDSVVSIGEQAFFGCQSLSDVVIGSGVKQIGALAFDSTALSQSASGIVYADGWAVSCSATLSEFNLLAGTRGIADMTFAGRTITEAVIPDSVRFIGDYAFYRCTELMSLDAGDGVERIGRYAFDGCKVLGRGYFSLGSSLKNIESYAFARCTDLGNKAYMGDVRLPSSVESIGTYAFYNTAAWNAVDSGLIYVGNWVVGFKDGQESVSITIADGTVGISDYAFYKKTGLGAVTVPDSVKYIGYGAFYECSSLSRVYMDVLASNLLEISDYTFYKCSSLKQVDIPLEVEKIGRSAFYKSGVVVAKIPDYVKEIGAYAFYGCGNLIEVSFGQSARLETVSDYAFANCASLGSFSVPSSVFDIGEKAFSGCSSIVSVVLGENLTRLGEGAFYNCAALESIVLPDSLKEIGDKTFYKCASLASVTMGSVERIGEYAFYSCNLLESVVLPASLRSLGSYAFRSCASLKSVTLRQSVEEIGSHAFNGCKFLTLYCEGENAGGKWSARWNSGYRPVVWGCDLSENGDYVLSFTVGESSIENKTARNGFSAPYREGYRFDCWTVSTAEGQKTFAASLTADLPQGALAVAVWKTAATNSENKTDTAAEQSEA